MTLPAVIQVTIGSKLLERTGSRTLSTFKCTKAKREKEHLPSAFSQKLILTLDLSRFRWWLTLTSRSGSLIQALTRVHPPLSRSHDLASKPAQTSLKNKSSDASSQTLKTFVWCKFVQLHRSLIFCPRVAVISFNTVQSCQLCEAKRRRRPPPSTKRRKS